VAESNSRGAGRVIPKTGLARRVHLSRRTREALEAERRRQFKPRPGAPVFGFDASNFRRRAWRRICERAGIENRPIKDLRDTYASWLLSLGVQLGYVSQQLGHADVAVTARHYALWCGGEQYQAPIQLEPGEVPADLLEWVAAEAAAKPETESVEGRAGPTVQAVSAPGPGGESAEARGV